MSAQVQQPLPQRDFSSQRNVNVVQQPPPQQQQPQKFQPQQPQQPQQGYGQPMMQPQQANIPVQLPPQSYGYPGGGGAGAGPGAYGGAMMGRGGFAGGRGGMGMGFPRGMFPPGRGTLGFRIQQQALNKAAEVLEERIWPTIHKRIEEAAEKGLSEIIICSSQFSDDPDFQRLLIDRNILQMLQAKLEAHEFTTEKIMYGPENALTVRWHELEEEEHETEEWVPLTYKQKTHQLGTAEETGRAWVNTIPLQPQQTLGQWTPTGFGRGGFFGGFGRGGFGRGGFGFRGGISRGLQGPGGKFQGLGPASFLPPETLPHNIKEVLEKIPCEMMVVQNWANKRLVLIGNLQPLDKGLQRMNRHQILSCPAIDESTRDICGILDISDVVSYLVRVFEENTTITQSRFSFALRPVGDFIAYGEHAPLIISNRASLWEALKCLAQGNKRLMVLDQETNIHHQDKEEKEVVGLITQMDFIKFLSFNNSWLENFNKRKCTIEELGLTGTKNIEQTVTVKEDTLAYLGFKAMFEHNVSGVAVVDNAGKIVDALSVSNARGLSRANFQYLLRPIMEYLGRDRKRGWWDLPNVVKKGDTLEKILFQFASTGLHRLFVVDEHHKPYAHITIQDVLCIVNKEYEGGESRIPL